MTIQLTVIGLNQVGVSIGLALQDNPLQIERVASDSEFSYEQKAIKLKTCLRRLKMLTSSCCACRWMKSATRLR